MGDSADSHPSSTAQTLVVAGWSVDPSTLRIRKDGRTAKLEPLTMAVLMYLAGRAGRTVSREELERELWGGQVVVYQALSNTIAKLRKAFEDDPTNPAIIETIPKIGYRLIADVSGTPVDFAQSVVETTASGRVQALIRRPRWTAATAVIAVLAVAVLTSLAYRFLPDQHESSPTSTIAAADRPSIAVLPFKNMSADPEQDYFADGMTEDLITDLAKLSGMFVIARNSTFTYKGKRVEVRQVAEDLGVRYVLEGSVRRSEGTIRINAQLIDAVSGGHVWAERFDSSLTDVFALQDKVIQSIVTALAVNLTEDETARRQRKETSNPNAYEALLRGKARYELGLSENAAKAVVHFEKALALDPNYSRAHGLLAAAYYRGWTNDDMEVFGMTFTELDWKMRAHLEEAMKNPTPLAHAIASKLLTADGRFDEAAEEARRALALDPSDASGYVAVARVLNKANRPAEALELLKAAVRIDPLGNANGRYLWRTGESQYLMGRYEDAAATMLKVIEFGDRWGYFLLGASYGQLGREQEARSAIDKFNESQIKKGRRPYTLAHLDGWSFVPAVRNHYRDGLRKAGMSPGTFFSAKYAGVHKAPMEVDGATTIDASEARRLFDAGVPFVDVRPSDREWIAGHIPGAVHLHLYHDFTEAALAKVVGKDDAAVIYGGADTVSPTARGSAQAAIWGFKKILYFRDGFPVWKAAEYPVETSSE